MDSNKEEKQCEKEKRQTTNVKNDQEIAKSGKKKQDKFEKIQRKKKVVKKSQRYNEEKESDEIDEREQVRSKSEDNKRLERKKKKDNKIKNKDSKEDKGEKDGKKNKENKNIINQDTSKSQKNDKKYSKKANKLGGDAFETMISYKIVHKFFLEDIGNQNLKENDKNFNTEQYLNIKEIKKEILDKLSPSNLYNSEQNSKKIDYTNTFNNNIVEYFNHQEIYDSICIISESISSSEISSESKKQYKSDSNNNIYINSENRKKKNINIKDITELEFDLFLKNIKGNKLLNFIKEMNLKKRLIKYFEKDEIHEDKIYNVCVEITVQSDDILKKKIPKLYKTISCFNFLYKTNNFFKNIDDKFLISESYGYFIDQTKFINFANNLILLTISNGKIDSFQNIENSIKEKRSEKNNNAIKSLDYINTSFNIYMIYYPKYDDEELDKLNKRIEKLDSEFSNYKEQQEEMMKKYLNEIERLNKIVMELKNEKEEKKEDEKKVKKEEEKKD